MGTSGSKRTFRKTQQKLKACDAQEVNELIRSESATKDAETQFRIWKMLRHGSGCDSEH